MGHTLNEESIHTGRAYFEISFSSSGQSTLADISAGSTVFAGKKFLLKTEKNLRSTQDIRPVSLQTNIGRCILQRDEKAQSCREKTNPNQSMVLEHQCQLLHNIALFLRQAESEIFARISFRTAKSFRVLSCDEHSPRNLCRRSPDRRNLVIFRWWKTDAPSERRSAMNSGNRSAAAPLRNAHS